MSSSEEDPRSKRGGHRLFDHSSFPDVTILRLRGSNFIISASYLALHSPFFYDLFYGPNSNGINGRYELDYDPATFGDLLDFIYPCYKKINCCSECTSSFTDRLDLALQLNLKFAVKRLVQDKVGKISRCDLDRLLQSNHAQENYTYTCKLINGVEMVYDISCSLDSSPVSDLFPDSTKVIVGGITLQVSASTLSLHSPLLAEILYKKILYGDVNSFIAFLKATTGEFPSEWSGKLLADLLILGAKQLHDYVQADTKRRALYGKKDGLLGTNTEMANTNAQKPNPAELELRHTQRGYYEIHVKKITGEAYDLTCNNGESTTIEEFKMLLEVVDGTPIDQQRLIFAGKQLEDGRTFSDYRIRDGSTLHFVLRVRGC